MEGKAGLPGHRPDRVVPWRPRGADPVRAGRTPACGKAFRAAIEEPCGRLVPRYVGCRENAPVPFRHAGSSEPDIAGPFDAGAWRTGHPRRVAERAGLPTGPGCSAGPVGSPDAAIGGDAGRRHAATVGTGEAQFGRRVAAPPSTTPFTASRCHGGRPGPSARSCPGRWGAGLRRRIPPCRSVFDRMRAFRRHCADPRHRQPSSRW